MPRRPTTPVTRDPSRSATAARGSGSSPRISSAIERSCGLSIQIPSTSPCGFPQPTRTLRRPTTRPSASAPGQVAKRLDPRVVAPLVHDEEALRRRLREPAGARGIVGERLLHVQGQPGREKLVDHRGVRARRRADDGALNVVRQRADRVDDPGNARGQRRLARSPASAHHRHVATERDEVAQDVDAPAAEADERERRTSHARFRVGRSARAASARPRRRERPHAGRRARAGEAPSDRRGCRAGARPGSAARDGRGGSW